MARATGKTTVITLLTLSLVIITSSFRTKVEQTAFDDLTDQEGGENMDKDEHDAQRENQESLAPPLAVNPVGGIAPQSAPGQGIVPRAGPARVIPNEAALRAVKDAQQDAQLQQGLYGGLLNNQDEGRIWTGGTDSKVTTWPGNDPFGIPIKLGEKVRNLVNNDVGKIVALESASGQQSLKFLSDEHGSSSHGKGISWLQPSDISHVVVGFEYIPPHQGNYKEGDKVIVIDPANEGVGKEGRVGSVRSGHGNTGRMRVDFGPLGPVGGTFQWFKPSQLKHAN